MMDLLFAYVDKLFPVEQYTTEPHDKWDEKAKFLLDYLRDHFLSLLDFAGMIFTTNLMKEQKIYTRYSPGVQVAEVGATPEIGPSQFLKDGSQHPKGMTLKLALMKSYPAHGVNVPPEVYLELSIFEGDKLDIFRELVTGNKSIVETVFSKAKPEFNQSWGVPEIDRNPRMVISNKLFLALDQRVAENEWDEGGHDLNLSVGYRSVEDMPKFLYNMLLFSCLYESICMFTKRGKKHHDKFHGFLSRLS